MIDLDELERKVFLAQESECGYSWPDETEWVELFENCEQHSKFIAALSPSVAQELIRRLREAERDATRYRWLRERDLETIDNGGIFAGSTPDNFVLNGEDLDEAIDAEMEQSNG